MSGPGVFPLATVSPAAPFEDLALLRGTVGDAAVVGIARGAHGTTELTRLSDRLVRFLVAELGFRVLAIEASPVTTSAVDRWLRDGEGDVAALLGDAHPWWRSGPFEDLLRWLRRFNERRVGDHVTLIGVESPQPSMDALEREMASSIIEEHARSGRRIVYWSGSHSAVGHQRRVRWREQDPELSGSRNAGSYLREQLRDRYCSLGLSFHHGTVRLGEVDVEVPAAPADYLGTVLASHRDALHLLRRAHDVAARPLRFRLVGPFFDPEWPAEMSGGPVSSFFDAILHVDEVSPAAPCE